MHFTADMSKELTNKKERQKIETKEKLMAKYVDDYTEILKGGVSLINLSY